MIFPDFFNLCLESFSGSSSGRTKYETRTTSVPISAKSNFHEDYFSHPDSRDIRLRIPGKSNSYVSNITCLLTT